ncbi:MAG: primosomal protein N' [Bacteroidota bacterium]|nr:primosomal protein N' [Bacteroidota bacterium]
MSNKTLFADIILPLPLEGSFTFKIPLLLSGLMEIGKRVIVQFGRKKIYTGIIEKLHNSNPEGYQLKEIIEVLDEEAIVNKFQFQLWHWMADYYMCTLGEVYKAALPTGLKLESETIVSLEELYIKDQEFSGNEEKVVENLKIDEHLNINRINEILGLKNSISVVKSLIDKKIVCVEEKLVEGFKAKTESYVRISSEYQQEEKLNEILDKLTSAPRQHELMMVFLRLLFSFSDEKHKKISRKKLLKQAASNHATLNSLIKKGILEIYEEEISRLKFDLPEKNEIKKLSTKQQQVFVDIKKGFGQHDVALLHGVTSSGKTEIYIQLISEYIKQGKQVLYLLPEIALTSQIINRLIIAFGNKVGAYHSRFSNAERVETWFNILDTQAENSYQLILGARSSLFLPFSNLGLIIVDEEHETSFKQHSPAPRYNARDSAIVLAKLHGAKILLGTATPSLESFYNAKLNRYHFVELISRYKEIQLPEILIADVKTARRKKQMKSLFSPQLLEAIGEALNAGEQVILFQNRRGFSPYMECNSCGWVPRCNNCDVSLTYHKFTNYLICHYCGHSQGIPKSCPDCNNEKISTRGFGTEKVEDEISIFFPEARVKRMDLDSTRAKNSYIKIISDFEQGDVDILVGTQMVSKGLDFHNVSLVGILNADNMMNFPDFRAYERSFQLMAQVSGRAGRKNKRGKVIIQVSDPEHPIIKDVQNNDFSSMFNHQISERQMFNYPPFVRLVQLSVRHRDIEQVNKTADALAIKLRPAFGLFLLGPEFPIIRRIQNLYHKNILIKIKKDKEANHKREFIQQSCKEIHANPYHRSSRIVIDVDPM